MKKGFTLIELLVVVLIIGILSAVALPQYQRTVLKSRTAEAWTNLKAIDTALKAYCLANPTGSGNFSTIRNSLDIEVKDSDNFTYTGNIDCADSDNNYVYANYRGGGTVFHNYNCSFQLAINPETGLRLCNGSGYCCPSVGFSNTNSYGYCLNGAFWNGCYLE